MKTIEVNGQKVTLTPEELKVFMFLHSKYGRTITSKEINDGCFQVVDNQDTYVQNYMQSLGQKLGENIITSPSTNNYKLIITSLNTAL